MAFGLWFIMHRMALSLIRACRGSRRKARRAEGPIHSPVSRFIDRKKMAYLYILRLKSGNLYIGATTDLKQRYQDHLNGRACRTTKLDPPLKLVYSESLITFSDARKREAQIKRWSRAKKEALVVSDMVKLRNLSKSRNIKEF